MKMATRAPVPRLRRGVNLGMASMGEARPATASGAEERLLSAEERHATVGQRTLESGKAGALRLVSAGGVAGLGPGPGGAPLPNSPQAEVARRELLAGRLEAAGGSRVDDETQRQRETEQPAAVLYGHRAVGGSPVAIGGTRSDTRTNARDIAETDVASWGATAIAHQAGHQERPATLTVAEHRSSGTGPGPRADVGNGTRVRGLLDAEDELRLELTR